MTLDTQKMRELAAAATEGPWKKDRNWSITGPKHDWDRTWPFADTVVADEKKDLLDIVQMDQSICRVDWGRICGASYHLGAKGVVQGSANQDFIIGARTFVPAACDRIKELEAALQRIYMNEPMDSWLSKVAYVALGR